MKKSFISSWVAALAVLASGHANAQISLAPLTSFGVNGWLSPGTSSYLGTGNNERGLAYGNDHVYLVSRTSVSGSSLNIRILNKNTGADLGGLLTGSGIITGGLFPVNTVRVGADGAIYVANMTTAAPANGNFRIYRWADELATPTVAYSGAPLAGARIGDSFDVRGGGSATLMVAGYNSSPSITGNNGYAIIDASGNATHVAFAGTPPAAGAFRLGLTFTDSSHVIGLLSQGSPSTSSTFNYTSFSGGTGTLLNNLNLPGSNLQTITDYAEIGGIPLLATQSSGDSTVRIWNIGNPGSPALVASANNTTGTLAGNANGTGQMQWGDIEYDGVNGVWKAKLWTMSSNQGIQAFVVTVPEPSAAAMAAMGLGLLAMRLIRRKSRA